jgi:hypothetical protein
VTLRHAPPRSPAASATLAPGAFTFTWSPVSRANAYQVIVDNKAYKVYGGSSDRYQLKLGSELAGRPIGWYVSACNSDTGCSLAGDQRVFYVRP